jgi:hypothetical protein
LCGSTCGRGDSEAGEHNTHKGRCSGPRRERATPVHVSAQRPFITASRYCRIESSDMGT